jgi:hypothetical protein
MRRRRNFFKILTGKCLENRSVRVSTKIWEDNIKINIRKILLGERDDKRN